MSELQFRDLPKNVQSILSSFDESSDNLFPECERIDHDLKPFGYTTDYDMSGQIVEIKKICQKK